MTLILIEQLPDMQSCKTNWDTLKSWTSHTHTHTHSNQLPKKLFRVYIGTVLGIEMKKYFRITT